MFNDNNSRNVDWSTAQENSNERVRHLLGWPTRTPIDKLPPTVTAEARAYGPGTQRSLAAYMKEAQIDRVKQTLGNTCLH